MSFFGFNPFSTGVQEGFGAFLRSQGEAGISSAFANAGRDQKTGVVPSGAAREQFIRNQKVRAQNEATRLAVKQVTDRLRHAAGLARGTVQPGARSASSKALVAGATKPVVSKPASAGTGTSRKARFRASVRARFARFGNRRTR